MTLAKSLDSVATRLAAGGAGLGIVVVAPGQQAATAAQLAETLGLQPPQPLSENTILGGPQTVVSAGLPTERRSKASVARLLNDRRNWLSERARRLVVVVSRTELADLQTAAPDAYSSALFVTSVAFQAQADVDVEAALKSLSRWYRDRFGRLDLRGFVRSEAEDVSWRVEDVYQELRASPANIEIGSKTPIVAGGDEPLAEWIASEVARSRRRTLVLLGHPGSGKSFFLRWLALRALSSSIYGVETPLPLLVSLPTFAQTPGPIDLREYCIESLLEANQTAAHIVDRFIANRSAMFFLDGLDEVGDESARRRVLEEVNKLREAGPGCLIVVTSRIAGYGGAVLPAAHVILSPFDDPTIHRFLERWCELYSVDRNGNSDWARNKGRSEGRLLASDVLHNSGVRELARNPLLLTVLAIVHRAGVRLPDHRVELYDHATRVLVERWNGVRSFSGQSGAPPLKTADAVRLLGPVALELMESSVRGAIAEADLRGLLERSLSAGTLRGIATPDEAITLFRNSLGLLVEQAPSVYSFLHLTLAEYFAAWELVRSGRLEVLARDATRAYYPEWREVLLLAAGELGINRADDERLSKFVRILIDSAFRRQGKPSASVPSLLAGLLADDPGLSDRSAKAVIEALIPTWWFERAYGRTESLPLAVQEATRLMADRIGAGRFGEHVRSRLEVVYGQGIPAEVATNLARGGPSVLSGFLRFLRFASVDYGPAFMHFVGTAPGSVFQRASRLFSLVCFPIPGSDGRFAFRMSRHLVEAASGRIIDLSLRVFISWRAPEKRIPGTLIHIGWDEVQVGPMSDAGSDVQVTFSLADKTREREVSSVRVSFNAKLSES